MANSTPSSSSGDPLALPTLTHLLVLGTSSSAADLSTSESQLSSYEAHFHAHPQPQTRPWTAYAEIALQGGDQQGFLSSLLPSTHQTDAAMTAIRTLAIIRLKHAIEKYWRAARVIRSTNKAGAATSTPVKIGDEDKKALQSLLLQRVLYEENRAIALQATICISRIARTDFPNQWPDLLDNSLQALNTAATSVIGGTVTGRELEVNALIMLRSAEVVKRSVKELNAVKMLAGKMRMAELAKVLLPSLLSFFPSLFSATFPTSTSPDAIYAWATSKPTTIIASQIRVCHLLFKMMSSLAIADVGTLSSRTTNGGQSDLSNLSYDWFKSTGGYLEHVFAVRSSLLDVLGSPSLDSSLKRPLHTLAQNMTKHLSAFGKLYLGLLDKDKSRVTSWAGWSDIIAWYWTKTGQAPASAKEKSRDIGEEALMPFPPTLVIHTLLLLRRSLEAWHFGKNAPAPFDSDDFAVSTAQIVVDYFLPFEPSALERWESDPEQWTVEEEQAQTDYTSEVRPCAEMLLMVLAKESKGRRVGRAVWHQFLQSSNLDVQDLTQVVRRDAVYTALGRLRDYLPATEQEGEDEDSERIKDDRIDISKAFVDRLLPEAAQVPPAVSPSWVLIRRRVSWLLYEYSEKLSPSSRDGVYRLLTLLLDPESHLGGDIAVRLSAARTLGALVDDIAFDAEVFQPYLESAIRSLAELATNDELALMDSIALSTRSLSILIERSGPRVAPLVPTLVELAPALWAKEANDECKTRPAVLTFVKSLLRATESTSASDPALSAKLQSLVAPLVTGCLQPGLAPLLAPDALLLWHRAVRCAAAMQGDLFNLLGVALDVEGRPGTLGPLTELPDYAPDMCRVVEEYALWFEPTGGAGSGGIAREVVRVYGQALFTSFSKVLKEDPMVLFPVQTIDVIVQGVLAGDRMEATGSMQSQGGSGLDGPARTYNGMNLLAQTMSQTGLFEAIVRGAILLKESTSPCSYYMSLLSRLAISFPPGTFVPLLRSTLAAIRASPQATSDPDSAIDSSLLSALPSTLLNLFSAKFEVTASARRRKLIALGMCALLAGSEPTSDAEERALDREVYGKIQEWVGTWLDALADIREKEGGPTPQILSGGGSPSLGASLLEDDIGDEDEGGWLEDVSPGSARGRAISEGDVALDMKLKRTVKSALEIASAAAPQVMQQVWGGMDPMVLDLLNKELE